MRKIHDVLRLHFDLHLPQRQIARSIQLSQSTVNEYLKRFQHSGLSWPLPNGYSDEQLHEKLFGSAATQQANPVPTRRPLPDFEHVQHELTTNRDTCLQLLWEEYRSAHPGDHYSYTSFWRHYDEWRSRRDLVMRQQHRAVEKLFVDWAGAKIPLHDRETGEVQQASLFVAVLGASSYTYAEATLSQELEPWIGAHVRALEFLGGPPELIVYDFVPGHKIGHGQRWNAAPMIEGVHVCAQPGNHLAQPVLVRIRRTRLRTLPRSQPPDQYTRHPPIQSPTIAGCRE